MVDLKEKAKELSDIERKLLSSLSHELSGFEDLSVVSGVSIDSVRRAAAWLSQKGFAVVLEKETERFCLTPEGENALSNGMPENILLETLTRLGGKASFVELERESALSKQEFMAALGINKRKAFVVIMHGQIQETGLAKEQESFLGQNFLRDVVDSKNLPENISLELLKRGLIGKKKTIERTIKISSDGLVAKDFLSTQSVDRVYDVEAPVPVMYLGRRTPYSEFIYSIRKKLVSFGFSEMEYSMIVPEFYNFDVLYQPQNHPARTWSDTYQLKNPQFGLLPDKKVVSAIKAAHEKYLLTVL